MQHSFGIFSFFLCIFGAQKATSVSETVDERKFPVSFYWEEHSVVDSQVDGEV